MTALFPYWCICASLVKICKYLIAIYSADMKLRRRIPQQIQYAPKGGGINTYQNKQNRTNEAKATSVTEKYFFLLFNQMTYSHSRHITLLFGL